LENAMQRHHFVFPFSKVEMHTPRRGAAKCYSLLKNEKKRRKTSIVSDLKVFYTQFQS